MSRYWFDMARGGRGVRCESYAPNGVLTAWTDIKLEPFRVGGAEVWMLVSGESVGHAALENGLPITAREQTSSTIMAVVPGTMLFNQHPTREAFTAKSRPGTPISDSIRPMEAEFGRSPVPPRPTGVEADRMLDERLRRAEGPKSGLVAVPASGGIAWASWATGGFVALTLVGLVLYRVQAR